MNLKSTLFIALLLLPLLPGCSLNKMVTRNISKNLTSDDYNVFTVESDPQIVRESLPFTIKLFETLLQKDYQNPTLLLSTGKLYCLYSFAFIALPADTFTDQQSSLCKAEKKRAKMFLLRGRDYVLEGLEISHPGITSELKSGSFQEALSKTTLKDTSFLYWIAMGWASAIGIDRSDMALSMTTKRAVAVANRLLELDSKYDNGAAHELMIALCGSIPQSLGGGETAARDHFSKALEYSQGKKTSPYYLLAKSVSLKKGDKKEFEEILSKTLDVDLDESPSIRLQNTIYKQQSQWLLDNKDRFFKVSQDSLTE